MELYSRFVSVGIAQNGLNRMFIKGIAIIHCTFVLDIVGIFVAYGSYPILTYRTGIITGAVRIGLVALLIVRHKIVHLSPSMGNTFNVALTDAPKSSASRSCICSLIMATGL